MNNEKYYTPEIEEFHVGFECEIRNSSNEPFEWEKFKIIGIDDAEISGMKMDWSFYDSQNAIKENQIRVRYLDQEDIESLGFVFSCYTFIKDNYIIYYNTSENIPQLRITKNNNIIFDGVIKNKSELIKLLKQLKIYGN